MFFSDNNETYSFGRVQALDPNLLHTIAFDLRSVKVTEISYNLMKSIITRRIAVISSILICFFTIFMKCYK